MMRRQVEQKGLLQTVAGLAVRRQDVRRRDIWMHGGKASMVHVLSQQSQHYDS